MTTFERIWRGYGALLYGLGLIAGVTTFAMMFLVIANVIGRYAFNNPIGGAFEVTQSMLTILVFFSLALTQFDDGHIKVSVITRRLQPRARRAVRTVMLALGAVFFAWCGYATFFFALESYSVNEQEWGSITYPLYPFKFVVFIGLVLLSIQFALGTVREAIGAAPENTVPEDA